MTIRFRYRIQLSVNQQGQNHWRTFSEGEFVEISDVAIVGGYSYLTFCDGQICAVTGDYAILL